MEYFVKAWGGSFQKEKELKGLEGHHYFNSKEERDEFLHKIKKYPNVCVDLEESGTFKHQRTLARMNLIYNGKKYPYIYDFGYEYPESSAHYMFFDGNYSCDCNKSLFLSRMYENVEETGCGDEILIEDFEVFYLD